MKSDLYSSLWVSCNKLRGCMDASQYKDYVLFLLFIRYAAKEEAEALHREVLLLLTFIMQSVDQFLCYGKRLNARRQGLGDVYDRTPVMAPTEFGLACLDRHSARLGEFPQKCSR